MSSSSGPPSFIPIIKPINAPLKKSDYSIEEKYDGLMSYFQDGNKLLYSGETYTSLSFQQKYKIKQKILFLALQDLLAHIIIDLAIINYSQRQFFSLFTGSYFLRLISNYSVHTSDFDMKIYPFDTSSSLNPQLVLQKIKMDIQHIQYTLNNTPNNIGFYLEQYKKNILEPIVNYESSIEKSNAFLSKFILQALEEMKNNELIFDISPKPDDNYLLKIIIIEKKNTSSRPIIYALGDITIYNKETELSGQKIELRNIIKEMIRDDKDDVSSLSYNEETTQYIIKAPSFGIIDTDDVIPEFILVDIGYGKQITIPSYRYYYYEKKALYCDMISSSSSDSSFDNLCKNYDNNGRINVFNSEDNNIYLIPKFRKQLEVLKKSKITKPKYMGGKSKKYKRKSKTYKSCCKIKSSYKGKCSRKSDKKIFDVPRKYTRKQCKNIKGFSMKSSCAPYKGC